MRSYLSLFFAATMMSSAYAASSTEIMNDPSSYRHLWEGTAVQAYKCVDEFDATLKIVQFDAPISAFPRFVAHPSKNIHVVPVRTAADTLILSEGFATVISTTAERSLFGMSEETATLFSAGEFTLLNSHPDYHPYLTVQNRVGVDRVVPGSPVLIRGVVLNKKTAKMQALFRQNQAEEGKPYRYEDFYVSFDCKKVSNDSLVSFSDNAVRTLLTSMSDMRDKYRDDYIKEIQSSDPQPVEAIQNIENKKSDKKKAIEDLGPEYYLKNPEVYSSKIENLTKFVLHCENSTNDKMKIAMFDYALPSLPVMTVKHNESELSFTKQYSFDRLQVETKIASAKSEVLREGHTRFALIVLNGKTGDEIYPAGLTFYAGLQEGDEIYEGGRARQLRLSNELPTAFRPNVAAAKHGVNEFHLTLNEIVINRYSLDATIWLSWPLVPEYREKNKCVVSKTPKEDVHSMIKYAFKGLNDERKRITKKGAQKKI